MSAVFGVGIVRFFIKLLFVLRLFVLAIIQAVPDVRQADRRVKAIEDGYGRAKRVYDGPLKYAEMIDEIRFRLEPFRRERVEEPHGNIGD